MACYARNDHLGLLIPYDFLGVRHVYEPDFLVKLRDGRMLVLETKGFQSEQDRAKAAGADRWLRAVNYWQGADRWLLRECRDPQQLPHLLREVAAHPGRSAEASPAP